MKLPAAVISGFQSSINRYLRMDPEAAARMAQLDGKCIAIDLRDLDLKLFLIPDEKGIQLTDHCEGDADTTLRGSPLGMVQLGLGANTEKTLFSGDVQIDGDVETGQRFKAILDEMDIDWEEQLSKLTGDFIAHRLGNVTRQVRNTLKHGRTSFEEDISEYLQEELRILPSRIEAENFIDGVSHVGMDVERLEARIARLQKAHQIKTDH